jgi:hypothetical protein
MQGRVFYAVAVYDDLAQMAVKCLLRMTALSSRRDFSASADSGQRRGGHCLQFR